MSSFGRSASMLWCKNSTAVFWKCSTEGSVYISILTIFWTLLIQQFNLKFQIQDLPYLCCYKDHVEQAVIIYSCKQKLVAGCGWVLRVEPVVSCGFSKLLHMPHPTFIIDLCCWFLEQFFSRKMEFKTCMFPENFLQKLSISRRVYILWKGII